MKFHFGLKHPKMTTAKGGGVRLQVPLPLSQCAALLCKNALLFPEMPFYFPEILFCFLELPFEFSEVPSFYLLCASFSKDGF